MSKSKYCEIKEAEEIYFVSNNERTLPSKETIMEEIEKCIPSNYDIVGHQAVYNRNFIEKYTIHYLVEKMDINRYRIKVYYNYDIGILGYVLIFAGLFIGGSIGKAYFHDIGTFIGAVLGVFIAAALISNHKEVEQVCDRIVYGIKEYERAHLLNVSTL